jgi:hypothetical protein
MIDQSSIDISGLEAQLSLKANHLAQLAGAHSLNILWPKPVSKAFAVLGQQQPASLWLCRN